MGDTASPILLFLNPRSGGGLAAEVISKVEGDSQITVVRLPDEASTFGECHAELLKNTALRIVVCGGDGTVNWVISLLNGILSSEEGAFRPPLAIVPFGTGNDLSRSLGWGRGMTSSSVNRLPDRIKRIRESQHVEDLDVWNIRVERLETHEVVNHQMLNYFSIGVDAECAVDFEKFRQGPCKCCLCCRCMSLACYVPIGMQNVWCKRPLRQYCTVDIDGYSTDGEESNRVERITMERRDKTIIFLAIPSMYGGTDPWTSDVPRSINDKKFEVVMQGSMVSLGLLQLGFGCTSRPKCQGRGATIEVEEPCFYQVDGEGKTLNGPGTITITRSGAYPLIFSH